MKFNLAIVGATGTVGKTFLEILNKKNVPVEKLYFYASEKRAGSKVSFQGKDIEILELRRENIEDKKIDYALFFVEAYLSYIYAPMFTATGATVIDNSSCWRMHDGVPLIVPEVNAHVLNGQKLIANPNCSTIQAIVALAPLHKKYGLKRIVFSTYQAVSGAGLAGSEDLFQGLLGYPPRKFPHAIAGNVLPHIDDFCADGYTKEEHKMIDETKKILEEPDLKVTATAVRVPVFNAHSESINAEFHSSCTLEGVKDALNSVKGIVVLDDCQNNVYPMPLKASGRDEVFVGRIRLDETVASGVNLWVVADNVRKGAALNAFQILETLINK